MKSRNTKQKELILETIKDNRIHPTINEIYKMVKLKDSTIGQATVYRNVKKFVEEKKIHIIKSKLGIDRYDYFNDHLHFECLKCGKVIDIFDDTIFQVLKEKFQDSDKEIINYNITLDGYCEICKI